MKAFDKNYKLLDEMYQDDYYPAFLVDKVKDELQKVIAVAMGLLTPNSGSFIRLLLYNSHFGAVVELILPVYHDRISTLNIIGIHISPTVVYFAALDGNTAHGGTIGINLKHKFFGSTG